MMRPSLFSTHFEFPNQTSFYKGKVRDVYTIADDYLVMIASDRISAFDVVLPKPIPGKGQILNQIASSFLNETRHIVPNWLISNPHPYVSVGKRFNAFKVEMVIRGYLAGHSARQYAEGRRILCGAEMPNGMIENDRFDKPIITPSTKASEGHDMDITAEEIIYQKLMTESEWIQLCEITQNLFEFGSHKAIQQGLLLVDTKYEFGKDADGNIFLLDEIHTPDSSRYFYAEGYEHRQKNKEPQKQLSKEFVRQWLIENNFMGKEGQTVPEMNDEWIETIRNRYIELFEKITGEKFKPVQSTTLEADILIAVNAELNRIII